MRDSARESGGEGRSPGLRIVLVRTSETELSRQGRLAGDVEVPLTERGRAHSARLTEEVLRPMGGVDAVYSAANLGSRETASILAGADHQRMKVLPSLSGVSFGLWEGLKAAEVRQKHGRIYERWIRDPVSITPPEGEEMEAAFERARKAARAIRKKHREGTVAVVAPKSMIALLYCHLTDRPAREVFEVGERMDAVEVVSAPPGR